MFSKLFLGAVVAAASVVSSLGQGIDIAGWVVDEEGSPLPGVQVELRRAGHAVVTGPKGKYAIVDRDYVFVSLPQRIAAGQSTDRPRLGISNQLTFSVGPQPSRVIIRLFTLLGTELHTVLDQTLKPGHYSLPLLSGTDQPFTLGMYLVKFQNNHHVEILRFMHLAAPGSPRPPLRKNNRDFLLHQDNRKPENKKHQFRYTQTVDTLHIAFPGYKQIWVPLGRLDTMLDTLILLEKPSCRITSVPNTGAVHFGDTVLVEADAKTKHGTILSVAFYADGRQWKKDTSAPYRFRWPTVKGPLGAYQILAVAKDSRGLSHRDTLTVTVTSDSIREFTCSVVASFPHDPEASTQGLDYHNGFLYEGTGGQGRSSLRQVDLESGQILNSVNLGTRYFGEGVTRFGESIIQLTWRQKVGFSYNLHTLALEDSFSYHREGWGITNTGNSLIVSDGSDSLFFWDPATYREKGGIWVFNQEGPVRNLNELEYFYRKVFANIWFSDHVAIIDPESGNILGNLLLGGLLSPEEKSRAGVLNGIAYDKANDRILVTGKRWPRIFEIRIN